MCSSCVFAGLGMAYGPWNWAGYGTAFAPGGFAGLGFAYAPGNWAGYGTAFACT